MRAARLKNQTPEAAVTKIYCNYVERVRGLRLTDVRPTAGSAGVETVRS